MRVSMRWSIREDDESILAASIEKMRGMLGANIRLDHSGHGVRRFTVSALVNGRFQIGWTGLRDIKITTDSSGDAARVAILMMKAIEKPSDSQLCQAGGHWAHGTMNSDGICQYCWRKAGNDPAKWSPAAIDDETWSRLEVKSRR